MKFPFKGAYGKPCMADFTLYIEYKSKVDTILFGYWMATGCSKMGKITGNPEKNWPSVKWEEMCGDLQMSVAGVYRMSPTYSPPKCT